jgi:serine phosphatase RsbU (regulator of sigma subunit)
MNHSPSSGQSQHPTATCLGRVCILLAGTDDLCYRFRRSFMRSLLKFARARSRPFGHAEASVTELRQARFTVGCYGRRRGGDCHGFIRINPSKVCFALLDVAGRRDENAAIIRTAQAAFSSLAADLLAREEVNEADAMIEICLESNRTILKTAGRPRSCPAFAGCFNEILGTVCYFNAGHTPGLLGDHAGVTELPATGLPLGLFSHSTPDAPTIALPSGAAMLLVSRGMIEARRKGKEFGLQAVKESLLQAITGSSDEICTTVLDELQGFMRGRSPHNDVTVLALARNAKAAAAFAG